MSRTWQARLSELEAVLNRGSTSPSAPTTPAPAFVSSPIPFSVREREPVHDVVVAPPAQQAPDPTTTLPSTPGVVASAPAPSAGESWTSPASRGVLDVSSATRRSGGGALAVPHKPLQEHEASSATATGGGSGPLGLPLTHVGTHDSDATATLPAAVATILASAVSQALGKVNAYQQRVVAQSRLLSRLQAELSLSGHLSTELEGQIASALADAPDVSLDGELGAAAALTNELAVKLGRPPGAASPPPRGSRAGSAPLLGGASVSPTPASRTPRTQGSASPSGSLRLGAAAIDVLQLAGWSPDAGMPAQEGGEGEQGTTLNFPFSHALVTAVALAHAGHPERLCAELANVARTAVQLKLETELLRSVVDQVRAEHGRRMAVVDGERRRLAALVQDLQEVRRKGSRSPVRGGAGPASGSPSAYPSPLRNVGSSPGGETPPSPKVGFAPAPPAEPRQRSAKVAATPYVRKSNPAQRPLSAGPRLAGRGASETSSASDRRGGGGLYHRAEQLHPPEAASPPVALKRGTGLGAGGGKLLHATSVGAAHMSAALLRAIGGRAGEGAAQAAAAAQPERGRSRARQAPPLRSSLATSGPTTTFRQRFSKSMGPTFGHTVAAAADKPARAPAPAASSVDPAALASQRIRQYRARSRGGGPPGTSLGKQFAVEKGVGSAMLSALRATSPKPAGLCAGDLVDSSTRGDPPRRPAFQPAASALAMTGAVRLAFTGPAPRRTAGGSSTSAPASPPIPPSLVAVLDRINAAKR